MNHKLIIFIIRLSVELLSMSGVFAGNILEVKSGQNVTISCPHYTKTNKVIWMGPQNLTNYAINSIINPIIRQRKRLGVKYNTTLGEYNLQIFHVTRNDQGLYRCMTIEKRKVVSTDVVLKILRKPKFVTSLQKLRIQADIGKVSNISLIVDAYPKPVVSWLKSSGGKLAIWSINHGENGHFHLISKVFLTSEHHLGTYEFVVRNIEGRLVGEVELHGYKPSISINEAVFCNTSNDFILTCELNETNSFAWENSWWHYRNGVIIRQLIGSVTNGVSKLTTMYCDYQDAGEYICEWKNNQTNTRASTSVVVYGMPIIVDQTALIEDNSVRFSVYFLTSFPVEANWYINENIIRENSTFPLENTTANMLVYKKNITTDVYRTSVIIEASNATDKSLNCHIQNIYGSAEASFDDIERVNYLYVHQTTSYVVGNISLAAASKDITKTKYPFLFLYIVLPCVGILVLLLVVTSIVVYFLKKRKDMNITSQDSDRQTNNNQIQPEEHYEEIDTISYQSVTWRNYNTDREPVVSIQTDDDNSNTDDVNSDQSCDIHDIRNNELIKTVQNSYEDLKRSKTELHHYQTATLLNGSIRNDNNTCVSTKKSNTL